MIDDSNPWRIWLFRDLREVKRRLKPRSRRSDVLERTTAHIERFALVTAFAVRKLVDSNKMSDELEATAIPAKRYPRIEDERKLTFMQRWDFDRFYDLQSAGATSLGTRELCNMFIHSFVFAPIFDEASGKFVSIVLNSDRTKEKVLFEVKLDSYFEFLEEVIEDDIVSMRRVGDKVTKSRQLPEWA